jgi:hypothetical protein
MKKHALAVFRRPPERLNCAQSVLAAWRDISGDGSIVLSDSKPFGGGRAPDGLCGALYAACIIAPAKAEQLKSRFAARMGSLYCKELRAAKIHPCEACVAQAAELLELHKKTDQAGNSHPDSEGSKPLATP